MLSAHIFVFCGILNFLDSGLDSEVSTEFKVCTLVELKGLYEEPPTFLGGVLEAFRVESWRLQASGRSSTIFSA